MSPHSVLRGGDLLIAADGGNSKTDVRLVRLDGSEVRRAVGGPFRPQALGVPAAMAVLAGLVRELLAPGDVTGPVRGMAAFLAGADLPEEVET
ncbi:MAG: ATPase, partial [Catenulispora sp.]|nr:ATPase [Catenulispora sp.]